ncbi:hypothetical protein [Pallidibacillus pasinlerensis]|uniref:Uncharacterized protein n=1 Tax=Pallidibacillus pasinlerensis TaxID=2703818 RepID=A0ABX0A517_9BACI|nr:hypothetical protein [Pallidibacillus pasinlerensis]NCU18522.1 hypothetical protein [Pallidibacillus pasinlerensis]
MPKVTNFAFCKSFIIEGPSVQLDLLQTIKTSVSSIAFSIVFSLVEVDNRSNHYIQAIFKGPKGEKLIETEKFLLEKEKDEENDSKKVSGLTMGIDFEDVQFVGQGIYSMDIKFDGDTIGNFAIPVIFKKGSEE